ncbi:hypothetical protein [Pseudanabaena cinerea]|jgi:hypothetical protein|nr:hypothetical protein [Pseudanabaena cinerea]
MPYIPPPKVLAAFADAVIVKGKTLIQGSNQKTETLADDRQ